MKKRGIIFLIIVSFLLVGYILADLIDRKFVNKKALFESVTNSPLDITPTSTPTLTPSPIPTASPTPKPKNTPTPRPLQPKILQSEIHTLMERFAGQYAVDVNVLRHIAVCESGFNPSAVNGPYAGLYQFNIATWKNNRVLMGEDTNPDLRFSAEESIQTAAYLISRGRRSLWPNCYP